MSRRRALRTQPSPDIFVAPCSIKFHVDGPDGPADEASIVRFLCKMRGGVKLRSMAKHVMANTTRVVVNSSPGVVSSHVTEEGILALVDEMHAALVAAFVDTPIDVLSVNRITELQWETMSKDGYTMVDDDDEN